jgi:GST-like protein
MMLTLLGPMAGQGHHFRQYPPEKIPYAIDRYTNEANRLYGVMNRRLVDREFLAGAYSVADMAALPLGRPLPVPGPESRGLPARQRWFNAMKARPAVARGLGVGRELRNPAGMDEEATKVLFARTAKTVG